MGLSWVTHSETPDLADVARRRSYRPRHASAPPYQRLPLAALRLAPAATRSISRFPRPGAPAATPPYFLRAFAFSNGRVLADVARDVIDRGLGWDDRSMLGPGDVPHRRL